MSPMWRRARPGCGRRAPPRSAVGAAGPRRSVGATTPAFLLHPHHVDPLEPELGLADRPRRERATTGSCANAGTSAADEVGKRGRARSSHSSSTRRGAGCRACAAGSPGTTRVRRAARSSAWLRARSSRSGVDARPRPGVEREPHADVDAGRHAAPTRARGRTDRRRADAGRADLGDAHPPRREQAEARRSRRRPRARRAPSSRGVDVEPGVELGDPCQADRHQRRHQDRDHDGEQRARPRRSPRPRATHEQRQSSRCMPSPRRTRSSPASTNAWRTSA